MGQALNGATSASASVSVSVSARARTAATSSAAGGVGLVPLALMYGPVLSDEGTGK